jgi:hypothetical protein
MLDSAMGTLVLHMTAGELRDFAHSGWADRAAWYYWNEEYAGSLGYFVLLAMVCPLVGTLGGLVGGVLLPRMSRGGAARA